MTVFLNNKYTKWYYTLVAFRQKQPPQMESIEVHHVIPRCLGGTDAEDNLVSLTLREHYIAHLLLTKMGVDENARVRLHWAFHRTLFGRESNARSFAHNRQRWIRFLKENHPSSRVDGWSEKISEITRKHWEDNPQRRKDISAVFRAQHERRKRENPEEYYESQKRNSKLGAAKAKLVRGAKVEYNGEVYECWGDLYKETGISKHLYKKFYLKGIDPVFRVGKDGPMAKDEIKTMMEFFCKKNFMDVPVKQEDIEKVLNRMKGVGLVKEKEIVNFFGKESP